MSDIDISNVPRRIVYTASGTGPYAFTFEILQQTDIAVYRDDTLLTLTTDYTVTINTNGTGSVTLTATPTGATQISIVGDRTIQRTTDFQTGGDLFAQSLNDELDSLTIFAQQNAEGVGRALRAPETDPLTIDMILPRKADRAGKYMAFDVDGNPDIGVSVVDVTSIVGIEDEIAILGAIPGDITTVAGISADVQTVAGDSASIQSLADKSVQIGVIGDDLAGTGWSYDLGSVADAASGVPAATPDGYIVAVYNDLTNINTVATDIANVNSVAGISADVTTVASNIADVNTVADEIGGVGILADIAGLSYAGNANKVLTVNSTANGVLFATAASGSGTVTSVDMTVPTGLQVANNPITTSGTLAITYATGYSIPTTSSQSNWDTAYTDRLKWDGGATGLNATTGRTSLGLGTIATQAASNVSITGGSITGITDLAVADGGTGASTAADARTNLGLGTIATQASSNVSITGGSITGITDIAVADGGTGASTAANARVNLLPSYTGNNSKVLAINSGGTDVEWVSASGSGTVTSVGISSTDLSVSGSPITSSGSITIDLNTVAVNKGGTGSTTASGARVNLLPSYSANNGKILAVNSGATDVEWISAGGTGTVTSVAQSFTGGLISVSGSPITSAGTLALTVAGTSGGIPYFSSASTWASSGALTANAIMLGGGAGAAPTTTTTGTGVVTALGVNTGTAGAFVVNGGALGTPSSGTVTNLTGTASININGTVGATTPNTGAFTSITSTSASGVLTRAAATQDGVALVGRAGGTSSYEVTITPTTLSADRTLTLPDASGTILQSGTAVTVAQGGTGITSGTSGGVPYFSSTSAIASSAALASNALVVGGGAGAAPSTITTGSGVVTALGVATGTAGAFVVNGGALGTPSSGTVTNLTGTASININGTVGATTPAAGKFTTLEATGVTTVSAGTVGAPAITTTGDTNTGIFFPAADTIAFAEGGAEVARFDSNGRLGVGNTSPACALDVTGGIQTSRTGVTSPASTDGNIFSGTYTPTLTNVNNVAASTAYTCQYMRVGNVVTVSGRVDIDPSAQQDTTLGVSLPIASNFTANENLGGTFVSQQATDAKVPGVIYADSTNDRATFYFRPTVATNQSYTFTFTYQVI
jgi:hypothetical protein